MIGHHPGIMDHGRSLVVWPDALGHDGAVGMLGRVIPLGARVMFLGTVDELEHALGTALPCRPLEIMTIRDQHPPRRPDLVEVDNWSTRVVAATHELQRRCGITPLPSDALRFGNPTNAWRHWLVARPAPGAQDGVVGVIHQQLLARPLDDVWSAGSVLTAGLAVAPDRRGLGLGAALLATAATTGATSAVAFADPDNGTKGMLERCGWKESGRLAQLVHWR